MGNLVNGGLIDRTACSPFSYYLSSVTVQATYTTMLSVNGHGYLDWFSTQSGSNAGQMRITVDGVVKVEIYVGPNYGMAFMNKDLLTPSATTNTGANYIFVIGSNGNGIYYDSSANLVSYPYTNNVSANNNVVSLSSQPIYFTQSLLIEGCCPSTASVYKYSAWGGYY